MYIQNTKYTPERPTFLKSAKYQNFTHTVSDLIEPDEGGKKIVPAGSFLDKNGLVVSDSTAIGILFKDTDVTLGSRPCALMVEGYVLEDRLPVLPTEEIKEALKNIRFY